MKIIAHSLVPSNPAPYLHIGYTAAAAKVTQLEGAVFLLLSIAMFATVWKYKLWPIQKGSFWQFLLGTFAGGLAIYLLVRSTNKDYTEELFTSLFIKLVELTI